MTIATGKSNSTFPLKPLAAAVLLIYAAGIQAAPVLDNPSDIRPGSGVDIDTATPNETIITLENNRTVLDWRSFSIAEGELVEFVQPGANSVVLNRVVGQSRSDILGELQANGRVFLINPNGIVFGANSEVNVGGLVASTLSLTPGFKQGFERGDNSIELRANSGAGDIENLGQITAKDIMLIAPNISNSGSVTAAHPASTEPGTIPAGTPSVSMIAAGEVTVNVGGSDLVLNVTEGYENAVINQLGDVLAQGGKIVLIANARGTAPSVINTAQIHQASEISIVGDVVKLTGSFNAGNDEATLNVQANRIIQDAALLVDGAAQLNADSVMLGDVGNDFTGPVDLAVTGDVVLNDSNALLVSGNTGALTLNATEIITSNLNASGAVVLNATGDITLNGLSADRLTLSAGDSITQSNEADEALRVIESTIIENANSVTLNNTGNSFGGVVNVKNSDDVHLRAAGLLTVTGEIGEGNLAAESLRLNGLSVRRNLTLGGGVVNQSPDSGVVLSVQGNTRIENASLVMLTNESNDFMGTVTLDTSGSVSLVDTNAIEVEGRVGSLELTANSIDQRVALTVENTSVLNASTVLLDAPSNDFKSGVALNVSSQATLTDVNNLIISGNSGALTVNANTVEIDNNLSVAGNLVLNANRAIQTAALTVGGTTQIQHLENSDNSALIRLDNMGNDFGGSVEVLNQANVNLVDRNDITVQGQAGNLAVRATSSDSGVLTLGELTANSLTIDTVEITQLGSLVVSGATSVSAEELELLDMENDFQGTVDLDVSNTANLRSSNLLEVSGTVNNATFDAATVTFNKLSVDGNIQVAASNLINQSGELSVRGTTNLQADVVELENRQNRFDNTVTLNVTNEALVHSGDDLNIGGAAGSVVASAVNTLSVSSLNSATITLDAEQVQLNNFSTPGDLTLNGQSVLQTGALTVGGETTLGAANVTLQDEANDFVGNVVLESRGDVRLRDMNNISLGGEANSLTVQAGATVTQFEALTVDGGSSFTANDVNLFDDENRFGGTVALAATQSATVHAQNSLSLSGSAESLTAVAEETLNFETLIVGTLNATADEIKQPSGRVEVDKEATLTARNVVLMNAQNDFKGTVDLQVTGQADIADINNLFVQGNASVLNTDVRRGTLTAGNLRIDSGNLTASTIELNQLNVTDNALLSADLVTQTQATQSGGVLTLQADAVQLENTGNDFRGSILLRDVETALIHDSNNLVLGGQASTLTASATGTLTLGDTNANTLILTADRVEQTETSTLQVQDKTTISSRELALLNPTNNFNGTVNLQVTGHAQLFDASNISVQGVAGDLDLIARGDVILDGLETDHLTIDAAKVDQTASLRVNDGLVLTASSVDLDREDNTLAGIVELRGGVHNLNTMGDLVLQGESARLNATADTISQSDVLAVSGSTTLQADQVTLGDERNTLNGVVRIEGASSAVVSTQNNLQVEGAGLGTLSLVAAQASLGELGQLQQLDVIANEVRQTAALDVQGPTNLQANRIVLNEPENDFAGTVLVQAQGATNPVVSIADSNSLTVQGDNLELAATVRGDLNVTANSLVLGTTQVVGASRFELTGALTQSGAVELNNAVLKADQITLNDSRNQFNGTTHIDSSGAVSLGTDGDLTVETGSSSGTLAVDVGGNTTISGTQVAFANSQLDGNLVVTANQISQSSGRLRVLGDTQLEAVGGAVNLQNPDNVFQGNVSIRAEQTNLATQGDLQLLNLSSRGGQLTAEDRVLLLGNIEQTGGSLTFTALGVPRPLSSADIALLLPPALDVFSNKDAVNPLTGLGRITLAGPMIHQQAGQIVTASGALTQFNSPQNGSVVLTQNNQINGQVAVLAGQDYKQPFAYAVNRGASLFAVNNEVRLNVGAQGVEADVVSIRARGLATQGDNSVISARMPYNDLGVGTARSYAGLTLSIPLGGANTSQGGLATFGESSGSGQSAGSGAIRVEVGDTSRPDLGGFLTVLPFEGSNLLPGQVVYLAGPERPGTQAFFYDGARSLGRIPVVYNGTLLLSPQENAALTTAQGAVVLARQEQTRSVVRTENVAGKIINGVVAEVGPGRPATEGDGGAGKPSSCDADDESLSCK